MEVPPARVATSWRCLQVRIQGTSSVNCHRPSGPFHAASQCIQHLPSGCMWQVGLF
jgi:hypothetical protein